VSREYWVGHHAVPEYKLNATVENIVQRLKKMSCSSLALTKKAIYAWDSMHFDKGLARAERYLES